MIEVARCRHKSICNTHYDLALGGFTLYGSCNPRYITFKDLVISFCLCFPSQIYGMA